MPSFFPIKIQYDGSTETEIVKAPEDIKSGETFRVLETNVSYLGKWKARLSDAVVEVVFEYRNYLLVGYLHPEHHDILCPYRYVRGNWINPVLK
jgi:hypothetical protein